MDLNSSVWHVISAFFVFIFGGFVSVWFGRKFSAKLTRSLMIYVWHTLFCFVYCVYVIEYGGDALMYYNVSEQYGFNLGVGTTAVISITYVVVHGLGLSFLGGFLLFNIFGSIGLQAFDASLRLAVKNSNAWIKVLATLIIFLPSVSFWSSAIGKDAISFMAVGLALWATLDLNRRMLLMTFAIALMFIVRPHMAGMMMMALSVALIMGSKISIGKKIFTGTITIAFTAALVSVALKYVGVGEIISLEAVSHYIINRQGYNMEGGGGVDIASMSFPLQILTYLVRPTLIEVNSIFSLVAALENTVLTFLFIIAGVVVWRGRRSSLGESRIFMWFYATIAMTLLAMTTANLGIALRQKWMFVPFLIFLVISVLGKGKQSVNKNNI